MAELARPTCCAPAAQESCCEPGRRPSAAAHHGAGAGAPPAPTAREQDAPRGRSARSTPPPPVGRPRPRPRMLRPADETGQRFGASLYAREASGDTRGRRSPRSAAASDRRRRSARGRDRARSRLGRRRRRPDHRPAGRPDGRAIGIDMTDEMLELARENASEAGVENVEFQKGYLEELPLLDASVDVVISNCVVNLSGDKPKVLPRPRACCDPAVGSRSPT